MNKIEFNAHLHSVISFLRTLVFKVESIGITDNQLLIKNGYPVSNNKRDWRYYLNMAGNYHYTDTPMEVISIDTGETIVFSKDSLKVHLATRRAYQPGEYWYSRLTEQYPGQIDLIHGILDPIDIDVAINSRDYKILRYNKSLIDSNENQLIQGIQDWIDSYAHKHLNNEYVYTEDLMLPTDLATMYGLLIPVVLILRLEAYGTRYVNDYHVWNKLNSFGSFSTYRGSLNHKQKMWLYRNIRYLRSNIGKNFTLDQLIDNLLTPEGIPIYHYRSVVDVKETTPSFDFGDGPVISPKPNHLGRVLAKPELSGDGTCVHDQFTPPVVNREFEITQTFQKIRLNFTELEQDTGLRFTGKDLLRLENGLAKDNRLLLEQHHLETEEESKGLVFENTGTKLLDSTMEDFTNRHYDTFMRTLYHQWVYQTHHDLYQSMIEIANPLTGERTRLNTRDALIYWDLLVKRHRGDSIEEFTGFYYQEVMRVNLLPKADFITGSPGYLPDVLIDDIRALWLPTPKSISPDKFFEHTFKIYDVKWKTRKLYSQYQDTMSHAIIKESVGRLYTSGEVLLHDPVLHPTPRDWLIDKELSIEQFGKEELLMLAWEIFSKSTGWDVADIISLRDIQKNLIDLMEDLTSYTVQFIRDMNDGSIVAEAGDVIHLHSLTNTSSNVGEFLVPPKLPAGVKLISHKPSLTNVSQLTPPVELFCPKGSTFDKVTASPGIDLKESISYNDTQISIPFFINLKERY